MGTLRFIELVKEILKFRRLSPGPNKNISKDLLRLLIKSALGDGEITAEEYDHLMTMLNNDMEPPPPGYDRIKPIKPISPQ